MMNKAEAAKQNYGGIRFIWHLYKLQIQFDLIEIFDFAICCCWLKFEFNLLNTVSLENW